jgi:CheY-like chemotaxis protein
MSLPTALQPHNPAVLVVDDEDVMRSMLTRTMEQEHYQVFGAADGVEALALLEAGLAVDLVITDLRMPRMDGRELMVELTRRYPHLPVVLISGYYIGGTDYPAPVLPKPFTPTALAARVREVFALRGQAGRLPPHPSQSSPLPPVV